jgi:hypothetical protein
MCDAITRRTAVRTTGGLPLAGSLAPRTPAIARTGASRRPRLTRGTGLVHADLHNHCLLSDGDGDGDRARAAPYSSR